MRSIVTMGNLSWLECHPLEMTKILRPDSMQRPVLNGVVNLRFGNPRLNKTDNRQAAIPCMRNGKNKKYKLFQPQAAACKCSHTRCAVSIKFLINVAEFHLNSMVKYIP